MYKSSVFEFTKMDQISNTLDVNIAVGDKKTKNLNGLKLPKIS